MSAFSRFLSRIYHEKGHRATGTFFSHLTLPEIKKPVGDSYGITLKRKRSHIRVTAKRTPIYHDQEIPPQFKRQLVLVSAGMKTAVLHWSPQEIPSSIGFDLFLQFNNEHEGLWILTIRHPEKFLDWMKQNPPW